MLYCTVLKYVGYTTYTNSYIWGFTLNKHTLYSTVLYRTKLCWIYTTILILGGFTLNKHTLYSTVLYCTVLYRTKLCWLYTTILILGGFTLNKHTLYSTVLYWTVLYRTGRTYPLDRIRMEIKHYSIININTLLTLLSWLSSLCNLHLSLIY